MPNSEAPTPAEPKGRFRSDDRLRRVLQGGASALAARGVAVLCSLITVPLTTRYLGPERYGIWVTLSTTITMLGVLDLGIANSLTNRISQAFAADDEAAAQQHYSSALWMSLGIAAVLAVIGFFAWPHLSIPSLFHVSDPALGRDTSLAVAVTFLFFLTGFPLNLSHRVLSGYQETQVVNTFMLLSNVLGLLVIVAATKLRLDLLGLTIAYSGTLALFNLALNAWLTLYRRPGLFPWPRAVRRASMRGLLSSGSGFFVLQLAGVIVFNSDNLVITHYIGPANILPYNVTWKLAGLAAVLQTAIFPSLWPAYAEAYARGNYDWVRRTFWLAVRAAMGVTAAAMLGLLIFGRSVIHWYIGAAAVPTWSLLGAICAWTLLSTLMDLEACVLAALDAVRTQGILSVVAAALNLALSIYLVKRIGPVGVVLGTIVSYAAVLVVPQTVIVMRLLYPRHAPPAGAAPVTETHAL